MFNLTGKLKSFIYKIYFISFFNSFVLLYPIYTVFMNESGISDFQLSTLLIIWSLGVFVFQFPAAWVARILGDKNAMIFGQICKILCFITWFMFPNYTGFAMGFILWSIQSAIYNVAYESMLYNELASHKRKDLYTKVLGYRDAISTIGAALAGIGSFLLFMGYVFIEIASISAVLITVILFMRLEFRRVKNIVIKGKKNFLKQLKHGYKFIVKTPCILYIIITATLALNFSYIDDYTSLIGVDVGLGKEYVGLILFITMVFRIIGQLIANKFEHIKDINLYLLISALGVLYILFSVFYSVIGLFLLIGLSYSLFSIIQILTYSKLQNFVPTNQRHIALAFYNIADQTVYTAAMLVIGSGSSLYGWKYSVMILGLICILVGLWARIFVRNKCELPEQKLIYKE